VFFFCFFCLQDILLCMHAVQHNALTSQSLLSHHSALSSLPCATKHGPIEPKQGACKDYSTLSLPFPTHNGFHHTYAGNVTVASSLRPPESQAIISLPGYTQAMRLWLHHPLQSSLPKAKQASITSLPCQAPSHYTGAATEAATPVAVVASPSQKPSTPLIIPLQTVPSHYTGAATVAATPVAVVASPSRKPSSLRK
jgi:hypothetical protein